MVPPDRTRARGGPDGESPGSRSGDEKSVLFPSLSPYLLPLPPTRRPLSSPPFLLCNPSPGKCVSLSGSLVPLPPPTPLWTLPFTLNPLFLNLSLSFRNPSSLFPPRPPPPATLPSSSPSPVHRDPLSSMAGPRRGSRPLPRPALRRLGSRSRPSPEVVGPGLDGGGRATGDGPAPTRPPRRARAPRASGTV